MGNYESVAEFVESEEFKDICYKAFEILVKINTKYHENVKVNNNPNKVEGVVNSGSNSAKTFNIAGRGSSVSIDQRISLNTNVQTTYNASMLSVLTDDPKVKYMVAKGLNLNKPDALAGGVADYGNPEYLLTYMNLRGNNVKFLEKDGKQLITFTDSNGINTEIPLSDVQKKFHEQQKQTFKYDLANVKNYTDTIKSNVKTAVSNTAENSIEIEFYDNEESTAEFIQDSESVINLTTEFTAVGDDLQKLMQLPDASPFNNVTTIQEATPQLPAEIVQYSVNEQANELVEETTEEPEEIIEEVPVVQKKPKSKAKNNSNGVAIAVVVIIVAVAMAAAAILIYFQKFNNQVVITPLSETLTGGYVTML